MSIANNDAEFFTYHLLFLEEKLLIIVKYVKKNIDLFLEKKNESQKLYYLHYINLIIVELSIT